MGADAGRQLKKNRRNGLRHSEFRRQCGRGARAVRSNPRRRSNRVLVRGRGEGRTRREWGVGGEGQGDKEKGRQGEGYFSSPCLPFSLSPCPIRGADYKPSRRVSASPKLSNLTPMRSISER